MMEIPCLFSNFINWSRIGSRTASVFPDPVGAMRRTLAPVNILGIAIACGGVGATIPAPARAFLILSERFSKTCWDRPHTPRFAN